MRRHRPHGSAVTTLEADILKLRALEMVLVLFYVEDLRGFIISTVNATTRLRKIIDGKKYTGSGENKISFKDARQLLISDGIITPEEDLQLKEMVDYRNIIGHEIHRVTIDIGALDHISEYEFSDGNKIAKYDYSAVKNIQRLSGNIKSRMRGKSFTFELPFDVLAFSAAERTYIKEIDRLKGKVNNQIDKLNVSIDAINNTIRNIPNDVIDAVQPGHPKNTKRNGAFTAEGAKGIFMLYDAKATPLAVSYIMRISYRTALRWYKRWSES